MRCGGGPNPAALLHVLHLKLPDLRGNRAMFTDALRPRGGFIPAETLVQNSTAGDNGTAGGTLSQPVLGFLVG